MENVERFRLRDYSVELVDRPSAVLNSSEAKAVVDECGYVARKAFGNNSITDNDIRIHAVDVNTAVYVRDNDGKIVGFGSSEPLEFLNSVASEHIGTVFHLKGTAILPEHQGNGLYKVILPLRVLREFERCGKDFVYFGTRTQNPQVIQVMTQRMGAFPQLEKATPVDIAELAEKYARRIQDEHSDFRPSFGFHFDKGFIIRKAYANCLAEVQGIPTKLEGLAILDEVRKGLEDRSIRGEVKLTIKGRNLRDLHSLLRAFPVDWNLRLTDYSEKGFSMYGSPPKARDDRINTFVRDNLNVANGDAMLLLGVFDRNMALETLRGIEHTLLPEEGLLRRFS